MDCRVQLIAGDMYAEIRRALLDDAALHVSLDEARGRGLVIEKSVGIDEEVLLVLVQSRSNHTTDSLRPAVQVEQPEDCGELAPKQFLALGIAHALHSTYVVYRDDAIRV